MYNDFPILSEQDYFQLSAAYNQAKEYNFNNCINSAIEHLNKCKAFSFNFENSVNASLSQAIQSARGAVDLALENINLAFNTEIKTANSINEFNVFAMMCELIDSAQDLIKINANEQKQIYKTMSHKTAGQLLHAASTLAKSLAGSRIKLFKYL